MTEESAASHIAEVKALAAALRERRFRFALEELRVRARGGMLETMPLDFVKIDGTLVQGLAGDPQLQQRVRMLVEAARKHSIQTVAERVEDANTMAVLWQVGIRSIIRVTSSTRGSRTARRALSAIRESQSQIKAFEFHVLLVPLVVALEHQACRSSRTSDAVVVLWPRA